MIHVLIADNQELVRQSLQTVLNLEQDIQVIDTVENSSDILRAVQKRNPNILLIDICMLESDDFACLQTLQENYPDIKVIILTTSDDPKYIFNTIKYGAKGYLLKEISTEELTNAIRRVHQGGAMIHGMIASKMVTMFSRMTQSNHTIQADTRHVTNLKQTEWQIIALLEHGLSNKEIASELNLSEVQHISKRAGKGHR